MTNAFTWPRTNSGAVPLKSIKVPAQIEAIIYMLMFMIMSQMVASYLLAPYPVTIYN